MGLEPQSQAEGKLQRPRAVRVCLEMVPTFGGIAISPLGQYQGYMGVILG